MLTSCSVCSHYSMFLYSCHMKKKYHHIVFYTAQLYNTNNYSRYFSSWSCCLSLHQTLTNWMSDWTCWCWCSVNQPSSPPDTLSTAWIFATSSLSSEGEVRKSVCRYRLSVCGERMAPFCRTEHQMVTMSTQMTVKTSRARMPPITAYGTALWVSTTAPGSKDTQAHKKVLALAF